MGTVQVGLPSLTHCHQKLPSTSRLQALCDKQQAAGGIQRTFLIEHPSSNKECALQNANHVPHAPTLRQWSRKSILKPNKTTFSAFAMLHTINT
jgi:hypothetical protein